MKYYKLKGKKPSACENLLDWAKWFEKADRKVATDEIDDIVISTVFLGMDHSFGGDRPTFFETMIFGGEHDQFLKRYETWEEAEAGHKEALVLVKEAIKK